MAQGNVLIPAPVIRAKVLPQKAKPKKREPKPAPETPKAAPATSKPMQQPTPAYYTPDIPDEEL
jgi:hypothetical protein